MQDTTNRIDLNSTVAAPIRIRHVCTVKETVSYYGIPRKEWVYTVNIAKEKKKRIYSRINKMLNGI